MENLLFLGVPILKHIRVKKSKNYKNSNHIHWYKMKKKKINGLELKTSLTLSYVAIMDKFANNFYDTVIIVWH